MKAASAKTRRPLSASGHEPGCLLGAQTWDWHIELDPFWHTHEVRGPGHPFAGVSGQGIVSKIGMKSQGLALHFNILGHEQDRPGGVPMHVLSAVVLMECATVAEAVALVRAAPISSSSLTLLDAEHAVSLELSPVGVYEVPLREGRVIRTNHFQTPEPLLAQKSAFEPDSSERFALVESRLSAGLPRDREELLGLLASGPDEPPPSCVADLSQAFGARWGTLCTVVSDPAARVLRVLDGMPTEAASGVWRELRV